MNKRHKIIKNAYISRLTFNVIIIKYYFILWFLLNLIKFIAVKCVILKFKLCIQVNYLSSLNNHHL